jgi:hypothetical protein
VATARAVATRSVSPLSGIQRLLLVALALDSILVIGGAALAPSTLRSVAGVGRIAADVGLLALIGVVAVVGPLRLSRFAEIGDICLWSGAAFALVYDLDLGLDFAAGTSLGFSEYWLFVAVALLASAWAAYRTRRFSRGIVAAAWALVVGTAIWSIGLMTLSYAFWRSRSGYGFWLRDGAVVDFRRSGATNLWSFLLEDIQGAVFFHPLLSSALGTICGVAGASAAIAVRRLRVHR